MKCMVCGVETKPSVPLCFCSRCLFTPEYWEIRKKWHERFKKIVEEAKVEKGMELTFRIKDSGDKPE